MRRQRRLICHGCSSGCRRMRLVCGARSGRAPVPSRLFAPGRLLCLFCPPWSYVGRVGQSLPHSYTACMSSPSRFEVSCRCREPAGSAGLPPGAADVTAPERRRCVSCRAEQDTRTTHELGSASHMAAEAQRELISRTGDHARDMRERMNRQAWAEPTLATQRRVGHSPQPGQIDRRRPLRLRGVRREERLRPDSAISAGGAAASPASAGRPMARRRALRSRFDRRVRRDAAFCG